MRTTPHPRRREERHDPQRVDAAQPRHAEARDARAHRDVRELPDVDVTDTDQELRVHRLQQREVERALADVGHQPGHVRLHERLDDPAEQDVEAEHDEQLVVRPAADVAGVAEDEREDGERRTHGDGGLKELDEEVHPVLDLHEHRQAKVGPRHRQRAGAARGPSRATGSAGSPASPGHVSCPRRRSGGRRTATSRRRRRRRSTPTSPARPGRATAPRWTGHPPGCRSGTRRTRGRA